MKVTVNTRALTQQLGDKAEQALDRAITVFGEYAMDRIRQLSSEHLGIETYQQFSRALVMNRGNHRLVISIEDPKMAAIETGVESFDIKAGLLASRKVKKGESGPYIDVPFQHKTGKRGAGTQLPTRNMREAVKSAMAHAKSTGQSTRLFKRKGSTTKQSDMLVHPGKKGGAEAQTFRRVSKNSPPDSWIYPSREGIKVFERVVAEIEKMKDQVIADIIAQMGGKT